MFHFSHQRSLATELTTFHLENKTQALAAVNGLTGQAELMHLCRTYALYWVLACLMLCNSYRTASYSKTILQHSTTPTWRWVGRIFTDPAVTYRRCSLVAQQYSPRDINRYWRTVWWEQTLFNLTRPSAMRHATVCVCAQGVAIVNIVVNSSFHYGHRADFYRLPRALYAAPAGLPRCGSSAYILRRMK